MPREVNFVPKRCIFEPGYRCNLKCRSCLVWREEYRRAKASREKRLSLTEFSKIAFDLSRSGVEKMIFIGGEPLAEKGWAAHPIAAKKAGIKETGIVTNGTLLDEKTAEKLIISEILDTVIFSIDGREENHDFLRGGKGVFEKAVNGLNILSQIKRKLKRRRPRIYVYMTLYRENIKDMEYVFNIALKSNANMLRYQTSSHITKRIITRLPDRFQAGFFHSYAGREKPLSRVEIEEIRENYLKILERSKKHAIKTEAEEIIKSGVNKKCLFVGKDFVIDSSGEILPCPMLPNVSIGSLIEKSVEEIFSGQKNFILELKKISESGKLSVCGQCCVEKQSKHVAEDKGQPLF